MGDMMLPMSIATIIVVAGLFLFLRPAHAIELQRRFYEKINWRIEPISMQKELRNTKIMGIGLIVMTILITAYFLRLSQQG